MPLSGPAHHSAKVPLVPGKYPYTHKLLALDSCVPLKEQEPPASTRLVHTPLKLEAWQELLASHPDQEFASYILNGIASGFRVGFNYANSHLLSAKSNMRSADEAPQVVSKYIENELALNRVSELPPHIA